MEPFDDFFDFDFINNSPLSPTDFLWSNQSEIGLSSSGDAEIGFSSGGGGGGDDAVASQEKNTRKRGRTSSCCKAGTKACREKLRRERLNERFSDLSCVLEPGKPVKTDKVAIIDDAIRALNQLKSEAQELKEANEKLLEEIKCSKEEKNELREEKLVLKADKERIERQLKDLPISPAGFMPPNLAAFQAAGVNKVAVYPNYGYFPIWPYLPASNRDTSNDQELRPPAA